MNQENTRALFSKFTFFYPESSLRESLMGFGFECGDGWYKLLLKLCNKIQSELNKIPETARKEFRVVQVKEKFSGLRFYTQGGNEKIDTAILKAEEESLRTCERCGKKGDQKGSGYWVRTLCKGCRKDEKRKMAEELKKRKPV